MFERIFDFIAGMWEGLLPFTVIHQFEEGVVLRLGKFNRTLKPGLHLVWPVIEFVMTDAVVVRTEMLGHQSLVTSDGKQVIVNTVVTSKIFDIEAALLRVEGVDDALTDACSGTVAAMVQQATWDELIDHEFNEALTEECGEKAAMFGILITNVQLCDLTTSKTIRLAQ